MQRRHRASNRIIVSRVRINIKVKNRKAVRDETVEQTIPDAARHRPMRLPPPWPIVREAGYAIMLRLPSRRGRRAGRIHLRPSIERI